MPSQMSRDMKASYTRLLELDAKLTAHDFSHDRWVIIRHEEGTSLLYRAAILRADPEDGNFVWVLTEHQGNHVFALDECFEVIELAEVLNLAPTPPSEDTSTGG